jgi:hypothetical protein
MSIQEDHGAVAIHNPPPPAEGWLEEGLKQAAGAVAALFADARAVDPARDEYGHARSRACTDAVAVLKAAAKVGHTIAELRGNKFEHTINVRRSEVPPPDNAAPNYPTGPGFGFQGRIRLTDERVCVLAPGNRWRILEDDDDTRGHHSHSVSEDSNGSPLAENEDDKEENDDDDDFRQYQGHNYLPDVVFAGGKHFVRGMGFRLIPEDWDEAAWRREQGLDAAGDPPTPNSEDSNGNFAAPEADAGTPEAMG